MFFLSLLKICSGLRSLLTCTGKLSDWFSVKQPVTLQAVHTEWQKLSVASVLTRSYVPWSLCSELEEGEKGEASEELF